MNFFAAIILALLLASSTSFLSWHLTSESYIIPVLFTIDFIPERVTVCAPHQLRDDVEWATMKWNEALNIYGEGMGLRGVGIEVVDDGCFARVEVFSSPLMKDGEMGYFYIDFNLTTFRLSGGVVGVWNTSDQTLRRAILLHEFGHMLGAADIISVGASYRNPVMDLGSKNPQTDVSFVDIYNLWLQREMRAKCVGTSCPTLYVTMSGEPLRRSIIALSLSLSVLAIAFLANSKITGGNTRIRNASFIASTVITMSLRLRRREASNV